MGVLKKIRERVIGDLTADDFPPAESSQRELANQPKRPTPKRGEKR